MINFTHYKVLDKNIYQFPTSAVQALKLGMDGWFCPLAVADLFVKNRSWLYG